VAVVPRRLVHEPEPEREREEHPDADQRDGEPNQPEQGRDLARPPIDGDRRRVEQARDHDAADQEEGAGDVEHQEPLVKARRPKMRPGEGITGAAAAERAPIKIAAQAHLDPRFKGFSNLPEDEYESILAVPILAREKLAGALNLRTLRPCEFTEAEVELLLAIAAQVAQTIVHAQLYAEAQRRVGELEALARISEAVSESLYLEESLEAIVKATMEAVGATGAALVLEDGGVARPEGRSGAYAVRIPLRWKGRQI